MTFEGLVGAVLLFSGTLKAVHARPFIAHVGHFRLLPAGVVPLAALFCIEIECALGIGLIVGVYPAEATVAAGIFLIGTTLAAVWGLATKSIEHCGCYGGAIWLPVRFSLVLNVIYILLLALAFFRHRAEAENDVTPLWKVSAVLLAIGLSGFLSKQSVKKPLLDLTVLRTGKKWRSSWLPDSGELEKSEKALLLFFRGRCEECKRWISILNRIALERREITVVGIVPMHEDSKRMETDGFVVLHMKPSVYSFLVYRVPTLVLLENGSIRAKWTEEFPDEILDLLA